MKFSVIVPVYNGEKFLEECLASLVNQGFGENEYEVLVINDGSTDGTEAIIDSFSREYPVVKKFNKQNGGVSSARNLGIESAKGDFVSFVDADDMVAENIYPTILDVMTDKELDVYILNKANGKTFSKEKIEASDIIDKTEVCRLDFLVGARGIYKKSILMEKNIRFDTSMTNAEDLLFSFFVTQNSHRIGRTDLKLYYYRINEGSVTSGLFKKITEYGDLNSREYRCYMSLIKFLTKVKEFQENNQNNALCRQALSVEMITLLWISMKSFYDPRVVLDDIKKNGLNLKDISFKYIEGKSAKARLKNWMKSFFRYAAIYKSVCFFYRKMK